jgi:CheY-like chemotaxis protein
MRKLNVEGPSVGVVLVVDDDDDLRDAIQAALRATGHRVVTASDGAEALAWLRRPEVRPCLVLMDLMMPGMNGFELRTAMTADPELSTIPVVVITGAGLLAERRADDLHADVLAKPFALPALVGTVKRYCAAHAHG